MNRGHRIPSVPHLVPVEGFAHRTPQPVFLLHDSRAFPLSRIVAERRGPAPERVEPLEKEIQLPQPVGRARGQRRLRRRDHLQAVPPRGERATLGEDGLPAIELGPREDAVREDGHGRCRRRAGGRWAGAADLEELDDRRALIVRETLNAIQGERDRVEALAHPSSPSKPAERLKASQRRVAFSNIRLLLSTNYIPFISYIMSGSIGVV